MFLVLFVVHLELCFCELQLGPDRIAANYARSFDNKTCSTPWQNTWNFISMLIFFNAIHTLGQLIICLIPLHLDEIFATQKGGLPFENFRGHRFSELLSLTKTCILLLYIVYLWNHEQPFYFCYWLYKIFMLHPTRLLPLQSNSRKNKVPNRCEMVT